MSQLMRSLPASRTIAYPCSKIQIYLTRKNGLRRHCHIVCASRSRHDILFGRTHTASDVAGVRSRRSDCGVLLETTHQSQFSMLGTTERSGTFNPTSDQGHA
jgi:hypothetical protein